MNTGLVYTNGVLALDVERSLSVINLLGVVAFSLSGAVVGVRKRFDLFGVIVLGCVTAVGGGSVRDALLDISPPSFLQDETSLWLAILAACVGFLLGHRIERYDRPIAILDTLGLGVFAVTAASSGLELGYGFLGVIFVGTISGVGGGIIRDILAGEVPSVLYREIYATAAAAGAITVYFLHGRVPNQWAEVLGMVVVVALRWWAIRRNISLPVRSYRGEASQDADQKSTPD